VTRWTFGPAKTRSKLEATKRRPAIFLSYAQAFAITDPNYTSAGNAMPAGVMAARDWQQFFEDLRQFVDSERLRQISLETSRGDASVRGRDFARYRPRSES
jgi:hypothetical protein